MTPSPSYDTAQNSVTPDERGLVLACSNCGQRNRLLYERLGLVFRCGNCHEQIQPPGLPIDVGTEGLFNALIERSSLPVLVDFWAQWCGPCRMVAPELAKLAAEGPGKWVIAKVNIDALPSLAQRFRVESIPLLGLFKGGREVARQAGVMPAPALRQFLTQAG